MWKIIPLGISAKARNISIVQVYAPTADSIDEHLEDFCDHTDMTLKKTSNSHITVILTDWNSIIGTDAYKDWPGTAGKFEISTINDYS